MIYKLKNITAQEIWFQEEIANTKADIVFYFQMKDYVQGANKFTTLLIDLKQEEEAIQKNFAKTVRNEINRAIIKDNLSVNIYDKSINNEIVTEFHKICNNFNLERNKPPVKIQDTNNFIKNNQLIITNVSCNLEVLVWHTYIKKDNRIRLKTSNSAFLNLDNEKKNLIGRANKLLHWEDMKYFKSQGYQLYDFGGWYDGDSDQKLLGINKFKESFGGYKEESYNYTRAITLKGKLYLFLSNLKSKLRK